MVRFVHNRLKIQFLEDLHQVKNSDPSVLFVVVVVKLTFLYGSLFCVPSLNQVRVLLEWWAQFGD